MLKGTMMARETDEAAGRGSLVTIFGGGGFVGRQLAQELMARGHRVRIAQRAPGRAFSIKPLGGLGQSQFIAADITSPASVAPVVAGSDAVVNLVGLLKGPMQAAHVGGAKIVAEAAAKAGARAFVHMSALGADPASPSTYGRTKGEGEAAARAAFPGATIVRPSIIFGRDDQFTNRFAGMIASAPIVPVVRPDTRFQPVFVGDVARGIATALENPGKHGGETYVLGGPETLSMTQILAWIAKETGRSPRFVPLPDGVSRAIATLTGWAPGAPITRDQYTMLETDNVVPPGVKTLADLGVAATPLAAAAPAWLSRYRKHGRFSTRVRA